MKVGNELRAVSIWYRALEPDELWVWDRAIFGLFHIVKGLRVYV